jgi:hypothetical protein
MPAVIEPDRVRGCGLCEPDDLTADLGPQVRLGDPADFAILFGGRGIARLGVGERGEIRARLFQFLSEVIELPARGVLRGLIGVLCERNDDLRKLESALISASFG